MRPVTLQLVREQYNMHNDLMPIFTVSDCMCRL